GVLELGGAGAVGRHRGPAVVPHAVLPAAAHRDHRLDGECHARSHHHVRRSLVVVRHRRFGVELLADPVAHEGSHHAISILAGVFLDGPADVMDATAGANGADAVHHALTGHGDQ